MGICHSLISITELKEYHNIDVVELWNGFVKECCEVESGKFIPYFVMDAAFLTYAFEKLQFYDGKLPKYKRTEIMKSLSYHLATLLTKSGMVPSWAWKNNSHFITSELCIGINVKNLPQPTIKYEFKPFIYGPN